MKIRIGIATYGRQQQMVQNLKPHAIPSHVELLNMNLLLGDLSAEARRLEKEKAVDAFVASGGNAAVLQQIIKSVPVVTISPNAYDVIQVLSEVSLHAEQVGCIFYDRSIPDVIDALKLLKNLLRLSVTIETYSDRTQLKEILLRFSKMGIRDVIGGSLALKMAAELGIYGHYLVTEAGLISAIQSAAELVRTTYAETVRTRQLSSILHFISEGVIATDQEDRITIFNPSAERIFGIKGNEAIGKKAEKVLANSRLHEVRRQGIKELNQIQIEGNVKVLTNRVPILMDDVPMGALATFRDINDIENAEAQIRYKLYAKGFMAKHTFSDLIGQGAAFQKAIQTAREFAQSSATVLIQGESGTGKELFAQSIHNAGDRAAKPFVAVNCAAIPKQLLESELFGYEEGAFTGARRGGKRGVFELGNTGTVFLDEVSEISQETQAQLLRVIEEREVMRIGSEKIRAVDTRIIAATNQKLRQMVQDGTFRRDLYYRLNILSLKLPTLAQRREDIPLITAHYLRQFCPDMEETLLENLSRLPELRQYDWPGNVRELRNVIERFSVLHATCGRCEALMKELLQQNAEESTAVFHEENPAHTVLTEERTAVFHKEKPTRTILTEEQIRTALRDCGGNKNAASEKLGISRATLWRKLKELDIKD